MVAWSDTFNSVLKTSPGFTKNVYHDNLVTSVRGDSEESDDIYVLD